MSHRKYPFLTKLVHLYFWAGRKYETTQKPKFLCWDSTGCPNWHGKTILPALFLTAFTRSNNLPKRFSTVQNNPRKSPPISEEKISLKNVVQQQGKSSRTAENDDSGDFGLSKNLVYTERAHTRSVVAYRIRIVPHVLCVAVAQCYSGAGNWFEKFLISYSNVFRRRFLDQSHQST